MFKIWGLSRSLHIGEHETYIRCWFRFPIQYIMPCEVLRQTGTHCLLRYANKQSSLMAGSEEQTLQFCITEEFCAGSRGPKFQLIPEHLLAEDQSTTRHVDQASEFPWFPWSASRSARKGVITASNVGECFKDEHKASVAGEESARLLVHPRGRHVVSESLSSDVIDVRGH